jgi:hypothetical protein
MDRKDIVEAAKKLKPKAGCKRGCSGKGYYWDSVTGAVSPCDCLRKSLRDVLGGLIVTGKDIPTNADYLAVLKEWLREHVKASPRMAEIRAMQMAKQAKK